MRYNGLSNKAELEQDRGDTTIQQALYSRTDISDPAATTGRAQRSAAVVRWVARRWELAGVLALMGSSAVYSAVALTHLGL